VRPPRSEEPQSLDEAFFRAFEGRLAIYIEKGALLVRVSHINFDPADKLLSADIEEIPTQGLDFVAAHTREFDERSPRTWRISTSDPACSSFSPQRWRGGVYAAWSLLFDLEVILAVTKHAASFPADIDPALAYRSVLKLLNETPYGPVAIFPREPSVNARKTVTARAIAAWHGLLATASAALSHSLRTVRCRPQHTSMTARCLRCPSRELEMLPESFPEMSFFACPVCQRHYARRVNGRLTYRWLHPISLALYGVIFDADPVPRAAKTARDLLRNRSRDEIDWIISEIDLELEHPTQSVREILENVASEEQCRAFLVEVTKCLKANRLAGPADPV
jgi:hypothetical protein